MRTTLVQHMGPHFTVPPWAASALPAAAPILQPAPESPAGPHCWLDMAGRLGVSEDLVGPAIFLASHASDYVTGTLFPTSHAISPGTGPCARLSQRGSVPATTCR